MATKKQRKRRDVKKSYVKPKDSRTSRKQPLDMKAPRILIVSDYEFGPAGLPEHVWQNIRKREAARRGISLEELTAIESAQPR